MARLFSATGESGRRALWRAFVGLGHRFGHTVAPLVTPLRGVTHPAALCAAYRSVAQSAKETGYTAERCNQRGVAERHESIKPHTTDKHSKQNFLLNTA